LWSRDPRLRRRTGGTSREPLPQSNDAALQAGEVRVKFLIVGVLFFAALAPAAAQRPKYGIKAKADKQADLTRLKTYAWMPGWTSFVHDVDLQIVAAVDRELANRGFVKLESEPSDMLVTYAALQRTDVDLKSKRTGDPKLHRSYPVGTLVVLLLEPDTHRELFRARGDVPLASGPAAIAAQIDRMVAEMFERCPSRAAAR
jgi:Domain of unknown function (DUF4136)